MAKKSVAKTDKPEADDHVLVITKLLLVLEETLTGSAPPHLLPDIQYLYAKLKATIPPSPCRQSRGKRGRVNSTPVGSWWRGFVECFD